MKLALLPLSVAALALSFSLVVGCAAPSDESSSPAGAGAGAGGPNANGEAPTAEDEVRSTDLAGTYKANTDDDGWDFGSTVKVARSGTKLTINLDGTKYDLSKTRSGAFVFTSDEISGDCDNPGCNYVSKVSGVVYLKKVGTRKVPSLKLTVKRMHPHPEYEGDIEGETSETLRFTKGR